ncbi:MAG: DNA polymerase III subunit beta [Candidatus Azambacteria bacterium]|nr:DNA polymerase III subunit beta [Candidatus Azambacteria bacterium]
MNITCTQENLKESLDHALRIVKQNSTLPILNNFLLSTDKGRLKISSTDLEIGFTSWISSKVLKDGSITIPAQLLSQFIGNLPKKNINLEVKDQKLHIVCDNIKASISGLNSDDFPIIPKVKDTFNLVVNSKVLKESLSDVVNSAALSSARPEISSVYLRVEPDCIKFISTDGFRLAHKTLLLSSEYLKDKIRVDFSKSQNIIIPLRTVGEVLRILGDKNTEIQINVDQNQILFNFGEIHLISRLIEGNYPDYEAIIPKSSETRCFVSKNGLEEAVRLSGCFSSRLNDIILKTISAQSCLEVFSNNNEIGNHKTNIDSEIKGEDVSITFNWRYFLDGLKNIRGDEIILEFNGDQKPAVVKPARGIDFFYILMPIKNV